MKHINKIYLLAAIILSGSCADLDIESDFLPDRPEDVAVNEFISGYDVLKTYVNRSTYPEFKLGMGVSASGFINKGPRYGLAAINFDEVYNETNINHAAIVSADGLNTGIAVNFFETAIEGGITVFGSSLCWHANQNATYLNELVAPITLPIEVAKGTTVIADFETDNLGQTYAMTGNGAATVVADPEGKSGNALKIDGPAVYSYPVFEVNLPAGRKLGEYKQLMMDFNGKGSSGLYGSGMRLAINDIAKEVVYGSPSSFGCPDGGWGRGSIVLDMTKLGLTPDQMELTSFKLMVGSGTGSGEYYIDNIKMAWESSNAPSGAETVDFESNDLGDTYEMSNGGSGTIVADPAGGTNHVLNVICNMSFPKYNIALPTGVTLGDCSRITMKFYGNGSTGRYGSGMRLGINDSSLFTFKSPADNGCEDNKWGNISLDLSTIELDEELKALNEFTITTGSGTGSGNYFIDDVAILWERKTTIEKTPEEKKEIFSGELETYIAGLMSAAQGTVNVWNVVNQPMSDDDNLGLRSAKTEANAEANFYWQDYLGEDYVRTVAAYARQQFADNEGTGDLKLFVNESGLEKPGSRKCERLIEMIKQWEDDGETRIDGIGITLNVSWLPDPVELARQDETLTALFKQLAESGKLIRISELRIQMDNGNGTAINAGNLNWAQQQTLSLYYEKIVRLFLETIPAAQCYGISLGAPVDDGTSVGLWNGRYDRKYTYVGFAEGLAGKQ